MTEAETAGWHHRLNGHESEQTAGDGEGQGGLACCSPWGQKETRLDAHQQTVFKRQANSSYWEVVSLNHKVVRA